MIILEVLEKLIIWIWRYILIPLVRFPVWLITARDCKHCKHYEHRVRWVEFNRGTYPCHSYLCAANEGKWHTNTACYNSILRKDFERKKR